MSDLGVQRRGLEWLLVALSGTVGIGRKRNGRSSGEMANSCRSGADPFRSRRSGADPLRTSPLSSLGEAGSVSRAARLLGMPKAKVSRAILGLERDYGAVLVERTTRGVCLTEIGWVLHSRATKITQEVAAARAEAAAYLGEPEGTLRIGCAALLGSSFLSPRIPAFLARFPKINLHLHLADRLAPTADRFDAVLHVGFLANSSFISRKIIEVEMALVATPEYLSKHGVPRIAEDLDHHTIMSREEPAHEVGELPVLGADLAITCGAKKYRLNLDRRVRTNDPVLIDTLVRQGQCICPGSLLTLSEDCSPEDL